MKKKLCIAGLLGIAICVLYACVRDGSPAPEPSGPSLRKAQGYFENRIEELKLPNPRFNLPGGNPVTKSGVPFDLLLGEGIHPLWEYARGYTCGELNIVEIPVSRSNHIRYSIYITEDGTEIRDVSEADTRLIVIEDMEHESMSSFLVTLLPSSDYEKGTRNLPYVLIDTDFSGISIYSDPSGAPTFGRYFVDGKEEYGFRFPENEEEFLPESFLRIGILWSEGNTRGIHDTNDMDPVGVSATLPFSPPEYEGFNFCIVCHHTTCICSPLKFQFHDLEGGGTGSIPIPDDPKPDKEPIDPCRNMKNKMEHEEFSAMLNELAGLTSKNYEAGRIYRYENDKYEFFNFDGKPGAPEIDFTPQSGLNYNIYGIVHTHFDGLLPIFSASDLLVAGAWDEVGAVNDLSRFSMGLVTSQGTYFLQITNTSQYRDFYTMYSGGGMYVLEKFYEENYGINENSSEIDARNSLVKMLNDMNSGMTLMKKNGFDFNKLQVNSNGQIQDKPC